MLDRIRRIQERSPDECDLTEELYPLRSEYNRLMDDIRNVESDIARKPLWDPLERLPPEIWPDIIQNAIEKDENSNLYAAVRTHALLRLTTVSRSWFRALTDTPVLWTTIVLNQYHENYAAMAAVGFHLSRDCEVDLQLVVTPDIWLEVAPLVVPHRHRIRSLILSSSSHPQIYQVQGSLPIMPNLRRIQFGSFVRWPPILVPAFDTTQMPSLKQLNNRFNLLPSSPWYSLIVGLVMDVQTMTTVQTEAWRSAVQARDLDIFERCPPLPSQARLSGSFPPSLVHLRYTGANAPRLLPLIGPGSLITRLSLAYIPLAQFGTLMTMITKLSMVRNLVLDLFIRELPTMIDVEGEVMGLLNMPEGSILPFCATLESLDLQISPPASGSSAIRSLMPSVHLVLLEVFPKVINLNLWGGTLTRTLCNHLDAQDCLKNLTLQDMEVSGHLPVELFKRGQLESLNWTRYVGPQDAGYPRSRAVRTIFQRSDCDTKKMAKKMAPCTIEIVPNLFLGSGFPYSPYSLPALPKSPHCGELYGLRVLDVFLPHSQLVSMHVLHVVEALAYFPYDLPQLENLHLGGCILEWDVVILMLERRNIAPPNGIRPIKHVNDMGHPNAGSSLLRTIIGPLLRGRFADREPLSSYSLTRVAERIQDKTQTGCIDCCHRFQKSCCMAIGLAHHPFDSIPFVEDNEFLEDPISGSVDYLRSPTPALSKSDAQWLSKIRERRANYMDCLKKAWAFGRRTVCHGEGHDEPRGFTFV